MGVSGSVPRTVQFGLNEDEKVTIVEGVKISKDVLSRMKDSRESDSVKPPPTDTPHEKPTTQPAGPEKPDPPTPTTDIQEELLRNFARQQEQVKEQLARLAEREREAAVTARRTDGGAVELNTDVILERGKVQQQKEKAKLLASQLESKEKQLASMSAFYKEQLELLEKKNLDNYRQTSELYNEAVTKAEAHIRPRFLSPVCSELQSKVLQCYRLNSQETLHCSALAKQYMSCVRQAKQSSMTNHG